MNESNAYGDINAKLQFVSENGDDASKAKADEISTFISEGYMDDLSEDDSSVINSEVNSLYENAYSGVPENDTPKPTAPAEKNIFKPSEAEKLYNLNELMMEKAQYIIDRNGDDEEYKDETDKARRIQEFLGDSNGYLYDMSEDDRNVLESDLNSVYDAVQKRRWHIRKFWDAIVRGFEDTGVMVAQFAKGMGKDGDTMTEEDTMTLRGLSQQREMNAARNPRAIGSYKDIHGYWDLADYVADVFGENVYRLAVGTLATIASGGTVTLAGGGTVAVTGAGMLGGGLATMAQNTGEAVGDQIDDGVKYSRGLALAQGSLYSALDGAFGSLPGVGKMVGNGLKITGKTVAKEALGTVIKDLGKRTLWRTAGKEVLKMSIEEGVTEALQSGVIGRGRRYLQTGSMLAEGETVRDALDQSVDEFLGGFFSSAVSGAAVSNVNRRHAKSVKNSVENAVKNVVDTKEFQSLPPEYQMLVGKRIVNDALMSTTGLFGTKQMDFLEEESESIDEVLLNDAKKNDAAKSAISVLRAIKDTSSMPQYEETVARAIEGGLVSRVDVAAMKDTAKPFYNSEGKESGVVYTDSTGIRIIETSKDGKKVWSVTNSEDFKDPISERPVFNSFDDAAKYASGLDSYNQQIAKDDESKLQVIRNAVEKMYGGRSINIIPIYNSNVIGYAFRGASEEDRMAAVANMKSGSPAMLNLVTKEDGNSYADLYIDMSRIDSLGKLYTVLSHERSHKDIADAVNKIRGDKTYRQMLSEMLGGKNVEGAEGMVGVYKTSGNVDPVAAAAEEMLVEAASVVDMIDVMRKMNGSAYSNIANKIFESVRKKVGLDIGVPSTFITDSNVRSVLRFLDNHGYMGEQSGSVASVGSVERTGSNAASVGLSNHIAAGEDKYRTLKAGAEEGIAKAKAAAKAARAEKKKADEAKKENARVLKKTSGENKSGVKKDKPVVNVADRIEAQARRMRKNFGDEAGDAAYNALMEAREITRGLPAGSNENDAENRESRIDAIVERASSLVNEDNAYKVIDSLYNGSHLADIEALLDGFEKESDEKTRKFAGSGERSSKIKPRKSKFRHHGSSNEEMSSDPGEDAVVVVEGHPEATSTVGKIASGESSNKVSSNNKERLTEEDLTSPMFTGRGGERYGNTGRTVRQQSEHMVDGWKGPAKSSKMEIENTITKTDDDFKTNPEKKTVESLGKVGNYEITYNYTPGTLAFFEITKNGKELNIPTANSLSDAVLAAEVMTERDNGIIDNGREMLANKRIVEFTFMKDGKLLSYGFEKNLTGSLDASPHKAYGAVLSDAVVRDEDGNIVSFHDEQNGSEVKRRAKDIVQLANGFNTKTFVDILRKEGVEPVSHTDDKEMRDAQQEWDEEHEDGEDHSKENDDSVEYDTAGNNPSGDPLIDMNGRKFENKPLINRQGNKYSFRHIDNGGVKVSANGKVFYVKAYDSGYAAFDKSGNNVLFGHNMFDVVNDVVNNAHGKTVESESVAKGKVTRKTNEKATKHVDGNKASKAIITSELFKSDKKLQEINRRFQDAWKSGNDTSKIQGEFRSRVVELMNARAATADKAAESTIPEVKDSSKTPVEETAEYKAMVDEAKKYPLPRVQIEKFRKDGDIKHLRPYLKETGVGRTLLQRYDQDTAEGRDADLVKGDLLRYLDKDYARETLNITEGAPTKKRTTDFTGEEKEVKSISKAERKEQKKIDLPNETESDKAFAAWLKNSKFGEVTFTSETDMRASRELFDQMVQWGMVDPVTGADIVRKPKDTPAVKKTEKKTVEKKESPAKESVKEEKNPVEKAPVKSEIQYRKLKLADQVSFVQDGKGVTGRVMKVNPDGTYVIRYVEKVARSAQHPDGTIAHNVTKTAHELSGNALDRAQTQEEKAAYAKAVKDQRLVFKTVTDKDEISRLENDPLGYTEAYASAQLIDGKVYSPMAAYIDGKLTEPFHIGGWQKSEENPDLVDEKGKFKLEKSEDSSEDVTAAYNPYWHSVSMDSPLNDQFSTAYRRPNLVMIKVLIPNSDLQSGYKAEKAKDPVGPIKWKNGQMTEALQKAGKPNRVVFLSQYRKIVEVLSNEEAARLIAKQLDGVDIALPANVVSPGVRDILTSRYGIKLGKPTGNAKQVAKYTRELAEQDVKFKTYRDLVRDPSMSEEQVTLIRNLSSGVIHDNKWYNISSIVSIRGIELNGQDISEVDYRRVQKHAENVIKNGDVLPRYGIDTIHNAEVVWYNIGEKIEDGFKVIAIIPHSDGNEHLINLVDSYLGSNSRGVRETIDALFGERRIQKGTNTADDVSNIVSKEDEGVRGGPAVSQVPHNGFLAERIGDTTVFHEVPVGNNGLIFDNAIHFKTASEESGIKVSVGKNVKTGKRVDFIDLMARGIKKGETRDFKKDGSKPSLPVGKWVGMYRDYDEGIVLRVKFGEPVEIRKGDANYKKAFIKDTNFDINDGGSKWYYPIVEMQDLRDNPQPINKPGNYVTYDKRPDMKFKTADDAEYERAFNEGDTETVQRMLRSAAERAGYSADTSYRISHHAPINNGYNASLDNVKDMFGTDDAGELVRMGYGRATARESVRQIMIAKGNPDAKVEVWRAVPKSVKDVNLRRGDWVSLSEDYARQHGEAWLDGKYRIIHDSVRAGDLYTDGNMLEEAGFDDGSERVYADTKNGTKLMSPTFDDNGKLIPLSKRFDKRNSDIRFKTVSERHEEQMRTNAEYREVYENLHGTKSWMKAPNGRPTNLDPVQWVQVRTPSFKKWFGDWENDPSNASKVVDENGEPKVVYHGTRKFGFSNFDMEKAGSKSFDAYKIKGFYFSDNIFVAQSYTDSIANESPEVDSIGGDRTYYWDKPSNAEDAYYFLSHIGGKRHGNGVWEKMNSLIGKDEEMLQYAVNEWEKRIGKLKDEYADELYDKTDGIYGVFLNIRNPENGSSDGMLWSKIRSANSEDKSYDAYVGPKEFVSSAVKNGRDGVVVTDTVDYGSPSPKGYVPSTDYIIFSPNQIKSATDNVGTFSSSNNDIRFKTIADRIHEDAKKHGAVLRVSMMESGKPAYFIGIHGSPHAGFTKFNEGGVFLTDSIDVANSFSGNNNQDIYISKKAFGDDYDKVVEMANRYVNAVRALRMEELTTDSPDFVLKDNVTFYGSKLLDMIEGKVPGKDIIIDTYIASVAAIGDMDVRGPGEYFMVGRMDRPLVIDCKGNVFSELAGAEVEYDYRDKEMRKIHDMFGNYMWNAEGEDAYTVAEFAKIMGFDGVVFKNMNDKGAADGAEHYLVDDKWNSNVAFVFNSKRVKLVDEHTADDNMEEIPVDSRMNWRKNDVRYKTEDHKYALASDLSVIFPAMASSEAHGYAFDKDEVRVTRRDVEVDEEADKLQRTAEFRANVIDRVNRSEMLSDIEGRALHILTRDTMAQLIALRNGMNKGRAEEESLLAKSVENLILAERKNWSNMGAAFRQAQRGITLDEIRDLDVYLISEVKAEMSKNGVEGDIPADMMKLIKSHAEELKKINDQLAEERAKNASLEKTVEEQAAELENERARGAATFRLDPKIREEQDRKFGFKLSDNGVNAMNALARLAGISAKNLKYKDGKVEKVTLNDEMRDIFSQLLYDAGNDFDKVIARIHDSFGNAVDDAFNEFRTELEGDKSETAKKQSVQKVRERSNNFRNTHRQKLRAVDGKVVSLEDMRKQVEKARERCVQGLADLEGNDRESRKTLGRYLRKFRDLLVNENPSITNKEIYQKLADEANAIDPMGEYDATSMLYVLSGKEGFDVATREAIANRLIELRSALEEARKGNLVKAAEMSGVPYESETDRLKDYESRLVAELERKQRKLDEMLRHPQPDDKNLVAEINALKEDIAGVVAQIRVQKSELKAHEKREKYIEYLKGKLADANDLMSQLASGIDPNAEARRNEQEVEISSIQADLKAARKEIFLMRSLDRQIAEYQRRIDERDFEQKINLRRPIESYSLQVQKLMLLRDRKRKEFEKAKKSYEYKKHALPVRVWKDFLTILGESKAIIGSLDLSSMWRQGGQLTWAHPLLFGKNFVKTLRAFMSDDYANSVMASIKLRKNWKYYEKAGVDFTDWGENADNADDRFLLNKYRLITRNKLLKMGVNASERAFSMYLNMMRADVFDAMVENSTFGSADVLSDSQLLAIGRFINIASQRGAIDKSNALGSAIPLLNHILWSPRNVISRFQFLKETAKLAMPWADPYGDKTLRKMFAKELVRYITGVGAMIFFAKMIADMFKDDDDPPEDLEFDPHSSNFLKVKFGNTRVDMLSGLSQVIVFATRMTGKTKNLRGEMKDTNRAETLGRFLRSKFSPAAGIVYDSVTGETFERQEIKWDSVWGKNENEMSGYRHIAEQFVPLILQDLYEQADNSGVDRTLVTGVMSILGAGVQAFDPYTYRQMKGDFQSYKRQYKDTDDESERQRLMTYHPMLRRMGSIEAQIKVCNKIETNIKKMKAANIDTTMMEDILEKNRKIAVNLMMGVKNPGNVE